MDPRAIRGYGPSTVPSRLGCTQTFTNIYFFPQIVVSLFRVVIMNVNNFPSYLLFSLFFNFLFFATALPYWPSDLRVAPALAPSTITLPIAKSPSTPSHSPNFPDSPTIPNPHTSSHGVVAGLWPFRSLPVINGVCKSDERPGEGSSSTFPSCYVWSGDAGTRISC